MAWYDDVAHAIAHGAHAAYTFGGGPVQPIYYKGKLIYGGNQAPGILQGLWSTVDPRTRVGAANLALLATGRLGEPTAMPGRALDPAELARLQSPARALKVNAANTRVAGGMIPQPGAATSGYDRTWMGSLAHALGQAGHETALGAAAAAHAVGRAGAFFGNMTHQRNIEEQAQNLAYDLRQRGIPDHIAWPASRQYAFEQNVYTPPREAAAAVRLANQLHQSNMRHRDF